MNIGLFPINNFGCGYYRMFIPFRKMESKYPDYKCKAMFTSKTDKITMDESEAIEKFIEDQDIIVIQRRYGRHWEGLARRCKIANKRVVYEIDDCFEGIPLENLKLNSIEMTKPETRKSVVEMMRIADIVTVSTPELKNWACKFVEESKVFVLKNTLDFSMWPDPHYGIVEKDKEFVMGFAGAESHKTDLRELGGSLEIFNAYINRPDKTNVRFGFFGIILREFWSMQPHVSFKLGVPFLEYPSTLSLLNFSIGLAPLKQCLFNECKSELRFLEHAACGVAVIATDIAPFRRCITPNRGILVENKTRRWVTAMKELVSDEKRREAMGRNSYDYVKENYNIDHYVDEWEKVYSALI